MAVTKLPSVESLKVPPHSIEAEQAVLGGLLLSAQAWEQIADLLTESDFYRILHNSGFQLYVPLNAISQEETNLIEKYRVQVESRATGEFPFFRAMFGRPPDEQRADTFANPQNNGS